MAVWKFTTNRLLASYSQWWRIVFQLAARLTLLLTVAVHPFEKPCICKGFNNLTTDGHGCTRIKAGKGTKGRDANARPRMDTVGQWPVIRCQLRGGSALISATHINIDVAHLWSSR